MKHLFIIRHAKSSWDISTLSDFTRTLNERGHKDAPIMAQRMLNKNIPLDLLVSSTAVRAFTTAKYFASAYQINEKEIVTLDELYHAAPEIFYNTITSLSDTYDNVAIFSHNPGITDFVNKLTNMQVDNMPTCSVFAIKIDSRKWADFTSSKKEFWFFDYPKSL